MPDPSPKTTGSLRVKVTPEQVGAIEAFQAKEKIATREEAVRVLLEIAVDTISATGNRFWDRRPKSAGAA